MLGVFLFEKITGIKTSKVSELAAIAPSRTLIGDYIMVYNL